VNNSFLAAELGILDACERSLSLKFGRKIILLGPVPSYCVSNNISRRARDILIFK
jgi:hypothetical protein